ncbi:MAG TPA: type II toxin-antitoxin system PemK/MazF family toxin [Patescibacteria group bacterium]|nr:type II toxin-antitoxin system PemK/MazF family toxin [Patescibacteria group bacterium]
MTIYVDPKPGMVIRYGYLWARQARDGMHHAEKNRPALILAVRQEDDRKIVYVSPITHTAPFYPEESILMPLETKARLGLDSENSWIMANEVNKFEWPSLDVRRVPGRREKSQFYGFVPGELLQQAREKMREMTQLRRFHTVSREQEHIQLPVNAAPAPVPMQQRQPAFRRQP